MTAVPQKNNPIIAVYSETNHLNIHARLGLPEYSYYFVVKAFVPLLKELGEVVVVIDLENDVGLLKQRALDTGRPLILLFFAPPHRMTLIEGVRTIPVIAWEFDQIPNEQWDDNPYNDWRVVLRQCGAAITHSAFAQAAIKRAMGDDFNVVSIPAPVWDRHAAKAHPDFIPSNGGRDMYFTGELLDSRAILPEYTPEVARQVPIRDKYIRRAFERTRRRKRLVNRMRRLVGMAPIEEPKRLISTSGTIYASILNPRDGRKNLWDMVSAFATAFSDRADATLLLKFNEHDSDNSFATLTTILRRHMPMKCRVVAFNGYLDDENFATFLSSIDYVVNCSAGEGQCLPLMELMSMGKPAIAPLNTSMHDYVCPENSFIVQSTLEAGGWPHDPRLMIRCHQYRISWESLRAAYAASKELIDERPEGYAEMGRHAFGSLKQHSSYDMAVLRMQRFLDSLDLEVA